MDNIIEQYGSVALGTLVAMILLINLFSLLYNFADAAQLSVKYIMG